ncbi:MAG TPA: hypothetical protein VE396_09305 [Xanthobacteraceae bacterium]|nr:hypothetical protein [Xanthobacteraceae bacterium]
MSDNIFGCVAASAGIVAWITPRPTMLQSGPGLFQTADLHKLDLRPGDDQAKNNLTKAFVNSLCRVSDRGCCHPTAAIQRRVD